MALSRLWGASCLEHTHRCLHLNMLGKSIARMEDAIISKRQLLLLVDYIASHHFHASLIYIVTQLHCSFLVVRRLVDTISYK